MQEILRAYSYAQSSSVSPITFPLWSQKWEYSLVPHVHIFYWFHHCHFFVKSTVPYVFSVFFPAFSCAESENINCFLSINAATSVVFILDFQDLQFFLFFRPSWSFPLCSTEYIFSLYFLFFLNIIHHIAVGFHGNNLVCPPIVKYVITVKLFFEL